MMRYMTGGTDIVRGLAKNTNFTLYFPLGVVVKLKHVGTITTVSIWSRAFKGW